MAGCEIPGESPDEIGSSLDLERAHAKFRLAEQLAALAESYESSESYESRAGEGGDAPSKELRSREGTPLRIRCEALRAVSTVWSGAGGEALCEAAVRRIARRLEW